MPLVSMNPGKAEVEVYSTCKLSVEVSPIYEAPGGLYPLQTRAFEMDEYRIMSGWPVSVPPYDIRCDTMISASGEAFAVRDDPADIKTGALIRWVANATYFEEDALRWRPLYDGTGAVNFFNSSVEYLPVLINDYVYRVENERFEMTALNFDSDTQNHMWADFTSTIGGSLGYTVIMVMSPNSSYGNNVAVPYNGLWCPGGATPPGETFAEDVGDTWHSVTMQGGYLYFETDSHARARAISMVPQLIGNAPMYLAMVFGYPESTFYVGNGPESVRVQTMPTGVDPQPMDDGVLLGRSTGDVLHTADMALFDVGIYSNRLTAPEIHTEFSILSRAYGGSE